MSAKSLNGSRPAPCPLVAIGASAGGLEACRRLLDGLAADTGRAFVIVQHLDPTHDSLLVELLASHTAMPVAQAANDTIIVPNRVYVIAPGTALTIVGDRLVVGQPEAPHGARLPIDGLLRSLAATDAAHCTAIILSGTGGDGSAGVPSFHAAGGRVIAQDPAEAAFAGMPEAAIATGQVDRVCRIADMPAALNDPSPPAATGTGPVDPGAWLTAIIELLRTTTAHDFRLYKTGTLERRIERRMAMAGVKAADRDRYLDRLRTDEFERAALAKDLLINVTSFFRDAAVFEELAQTVVPELVRKQPADQPIRLWVAGCSTGEETYSLAMLFQETIAAEKRVVRLQVFASDVDPAAVATARLGLYPATIANDVSADRLARFFVREDDGYRVLPELRQSVVFTVQDVLADPPFSRLDMVSCRNLLIYLGQEAQAKVIALLHFSLREGGLLLLGCAETAGDVGGRFEVLSKSACLYRHVGRHRPGGFGLQSGTSDAPRPPARVSGTTAPTRQAGYAELCRKLVLEHYAPAAVLIDARNAVLFSLGPLDRFLMVPVGQPTSDFAAMIAPALRTKVRAAVARAAAEKVDVEIAVPSRAPARRPGFKVVVRPVWAPGEILTLVCFVEQAVTEERRPLQPLPPESARVAELEHELEATRVELRAAIGDLEHAAEDQKSVNEEALSVNEEYQSTNEELLTSKEELQSLNEELTALNGQLQETLEAQRTTANDLQNVLYSTDVATLFLDRDLSIRFFTPATKALFHVIAGDIGRPLADLHSFAADAALADDARAVLAGHEAIEREVITASGHWCRNVLPYRTQNDSVAGVVITFTDITERKRIAAELDTARRDADLANTAKSRFLAAASHDLRQPLQTLALVQGLLANLVEGERGHRLVSRLDETIGAMTGMLNTLLDINQIEAGTLRPEVATFALGPMLDRLRDEFSYHAEAKRLELRIVGCTRFVASDARLLEQMLRNLISNALKYTTTGKVLVGCRRHGPKIAIEVLDTGVGIAEEELKAIFAEYHQIDNAARERSRGLGLGLAIVQRLGNLLGHPIQVRSRTGHGSRFWVEVPTAVSAEGAVPTAPSTPTAERALILIVEDDADNRDMLDMALQSAGHDTLVAGDAATALAGRGAIRPDLVLTDYNLPGGANGLELAVRIRAAGSATTPVIVLTGDISDVTVRTIAAAGCVQLSKPVRTAEIIATIAGLLSAAPPRSARVEAPAGGTVFIVDDDKGVRDSIRELLEQGDRTVETFASGEGFLGRYTHGLGGCLLLDAYMPGLSGLDLMRRLNADGHPLPTIMMTGDSDVTMAVEAMKAGALDFLEKPIGAAELSAAVDRALHVDHDGTAMAQWRAGAAAHVASLTARQHQIMDLVLAGHPSKNIAADLGISQRTVENHRAAIMTKTQTKSLPALARLALAASSP